MQPELVRKLAAEFVGTFGFFLIGYTGIAAIVETGAPVYVPIGFGFGLAAMIFAFGHISGGHFNPAVTAGLTAGGRFPMSDVVPYWVAQLGGGLLAALTVRIVFSSEAADKLVTTPGSGISDGKALVVELIFTFLFVLVIATVATDSRAPWNGVFAPLAIGLFIFTQASVIGPISGGSLNPAISLAPAIVAADLSDVWIYIIGPLAGGVLGGLVHAYFRDDIADRAAPWRHQDAGPVATD
jgi:MIP family channel proteins